MEYNSDKINESVQGGDQSNIKGSANLVNAQRFSAGAGVNKFEVNQDGVWAGGKDFASAPWSVDFNGKQKLGLSTGSNIIIDGPNGIIDFGYNSSNYGSISVDNSTNMIYVARTSHFFFDQASHYIGRLFQDSTSVHGLELNGGGKIQFTSGSVLTDTGSTLNLDRTMTITGDCSLSSGQKFQIGTTPGVTFSSGNVGGLFEMNGVGGIITYWHKF